MDSETERTGPRQEAGPTITSTESSVPLTTDEVDERIAERRENGLQARHEAKLRRGGR